MKFGNSIKKLIEILNDSNINELEVTTFWGFRKIRLTKSSENTKLQNTVKHSSIKPKQQDIIIEDSSLVTEKEESITEEINESNLNINQDDLVYQKAPLVGTFYNSPKPGDPPFVKVGDKVTKGQTLCIIEAMKIFNEIESDFDGIIIEEMIEDSNPVEFNQSIFSIDPS